MRDITIKSRNDISTDLGYSLIERQFSKRYSDDRNLLIDYFVELARGAFDISKSISPDKKYAIKISKDVINRIKSGEYAIRKDKKGELLAEIIDITKPKKSLVHILRMEEIGIDKNEILEKLGNNVSHLAQKQQLDDMNQLLLSIQTTVSEVKRGQMTDRIGLVLSGRNLFEQALQLEDTDPNKFNLVRGSIEQMNHGKAQLELALKDEFTKVPEIPRSKIKLTYKALINKNYFHNFETQFYTIEDGMYAYFEATRLLAIAYTFIGSKEAIQKLTDPTIQLISLGYEKMVKLSEIVLQNGRTEKYWFENPQLIIDEIKRSSQLILPEDVDNVSIEVTGKELIEGTNHE